VNTRFTIATRICVLAADSIILVVTWYKLWVMKKEAARAAVKSPVVAILLRDGTIYFLVLLILQLAQIVGRTTNDFAFAYTFLFPVQSMIISHFLLNLRQAAQAPVLRELDGQRSSFTYSQGLAGPASHVSSLRFASFVANMGEMLDHDQASADPDIDWQDVRDDLEAQVGYNEVIPEDRRQDVGISSTPAADDSVSKVADVEAMSPKETNGISEVHRT